MPKIYIKKPKSWQESDMKIALLEVSNGKLSIREAARIHGLSESVGIFSSYLQR